MKRRLIVALVAVNVVLAVALVMGPLAAQFVPASALRDCCQGQHCCENCCWFVQNCNGSQDCLELRR